MSEPSGQFDRASDEAVTLAFLAGGEGSRMGMPKGLLSIHGEPILSYLLRQIAWPGPTMLVSAPGREHPPGWEKFLIEVTDPEAQGPLRGVLTALENLITPLVVVTTVDMPGVRMEQLRWVIDQFAKQPRIFGMMCQRLFARALNSPSPGTPGEGRGGGCVERSSDGADPLPNPPPEYRGRENTLAPASVIEPFPSIYRRDALDEIARRLASSRRSVHGLLESASFAAAIAPLEWEPRVWMNLNRPEDLDAYLKSIDAAG